MTAEELIHLCASEDKICELSIAQAKESCRKKKQSYLNEWADINHRFNKGDIIAYPDRHMIMRVDGWRGNVWNKQPYVEYIGTILTKKLEVRKGYHGGTTTMYDDGRQIDKLK